jgi:hypothetical protein
MCRCGCITGVSSSKSLAEEYLIFYDQNTLGGAITHNMSKPFAAVTLYVSRLA